MPVFEADKDFYDGHDTQVLGICVDSNWSHKAWAKELGGLSFPLLSDYSPHGAVTEAYGITRPDGSSERTILLLDREGVIRYIDLLPVLEQPDFDEIRHVVAELK